VWYGRRHKPQYNSIHLYSVLYEDTFITTLILQMAFEENRMRVTHGMRTAWMLHVAGMFGSLVTDATLGPLQLRGESPLLFEIHPI